VQVADFRRKKQPPGGISPKSIAYQGFQGNNFSTRSFPTQRWTFYSPELAPFKKKHSHQV
jgi:hypothetical protein